MPRVNHWALTWVVDMQTLLQVGTPFWWLLSYLRSRITLQKISSVYTNLHLSLWMLILFVYLDSVIYCYQGQSLSTFTLISTDQLWFSGFLEPNPHRGASSGIFLGLTLSLCPPSSCTHITRKVQTTSSDWEGTCFEQTHNGGFNTTQSA